VRTAFGRYWQEWTDWQKRFRYHYRALFTPGKFKKSFSLLLLVRAGGNSDLT